MVYTLVDFLAYDACMHTWYESKFKLGIFG